MPFIIGGAIAAAGSLASGIIGASAAQNAAQIQANAANSASQVEQQMFNTTQANLEPWISAGGNALTALSYGLGLSAPAPAPAGAVPSQADITAWAQAQGYNLPAVGTAWTPQEIANLTAAGYTPAAGAQAVAQESGYPTTTTTPTTGPGAVSAALAPYLTPSWLSGNPFAPGAPGGAAPGGASASGLSPVSINPNLGVTPEQSPGGGSTMNWLQQAANLQQQGLTPAQITQAMMNWSPGGAAPAGAAAAAPAASTTSTATSMPVGYGSLTAPFSLASPTVAGLLPELASTGVNANGTFSPSGFENSPAYQFLLSQGNQAINNAASASGGVNGNTLAALSQYDTGVANTYYNTYLNDYLNTYGNIYNAYTGNQQQTYNMLSGLSGSGQNAAANLGGLSATVGSNIGSNIIGAGNAQAAGTVGAANAVSGTVNNLSNIGSNYLLMNALLNSGTGAANNASGGNTGLGY